MLGEQTVAQLRTGFTHLHHQEHQGDFSMHSYARILECYALHSYVRTLECYALHSYVRI